MAFAIIDGSSLQKIVDDCWMSVRRALDCLESTSGLETFAHLIDLADQNQSDLFTQAYENGIDISPETGALILQLLLDRRPEFTATALSRSFLLLSQFPNAANEDGAFGQILLFNALNASSALMTLQMGLASDSDFLNASQAFGRIAKILSENSCHAEASACAQSGTNLTASLPHSAQITMAKMALTIALKEGDRDTMGGSAFRYAQILINSAELDDSKRLIAYDAAEFAIRNLPASEEVKNGFIQYLDHAIKQHKYLQPLGFLLWTELRPHQREQIPGLTEDDFQAARAIHEQISELSATEWYKALLKVGSWLTHVENHRLSLDKSTKSKLTLTTWDNWSFEHPALLRAIPHATSLLRQSALDDFLLTLSHEITHVFSMAGALGLATTAMRWALFELEVELWSLSFNRPGYTNEKLLENIISVDTISPYAWWDLPKDELTVHRLARVEQLLELARKIQIIEDTWSPWFEGLALFGESADPKFDKAAYSPVANVISQLQDIVITQMAEQQQKSVPEMAREKQQEAEDLYSTAIQQAGKSRLGFHIKSSPDRYLTGYLAVRAIVAAWRARMSTNLSGTEAFKILLHATRWSGFNDFLPNLSTGLSEFEAAVRSKHRLWLSALMNVTRQDLTSVLATSEDGSFPLPCRWDGGRLRIVQPAEAQVAGIEELQRLAAEALDTRLQCSPELSIPDVSEDCIALINAVRQSLRPLTPTLFAGERISWVLSANLILPIGSVDCPFWLLRKERMVSCLIRTTEKNKSGNASYDTISFSINDADFKLLEGELAAARGGRMRVTRVTDLWDSDESTARIAGRNLVVFQFGSWMHIQPRGMAFGTINVRESIKNDVTARLSPNPLRDTIRASIELRHLASKTKVFMDSFESTVRVAGLEIDASPWLRRVQRLGGEVAARIIGKPPAEVAEDCATLVVTSTTAAQALHREGLGGLRRYSAKSFDDLVDFLFHSGQYPVLNPDHKLLEIANRLIGIQFAQMTFGWDLLPQSRKDKDSPIC